MPAIRVDGNDVLAVVAATQKAVRHVKLGVGPVFVEGLTYRMGPHSSSDDPTKYQPEDERDVWQSRDPIRRYRAYLVAAGVMTEDEIKETEAECSATVLASFKHNENVGKPTLESMFEDVYAEMPDILREQQEFLVAAEGGEVREDTSGAEFPL